MCALRAPFVLAMLLLGMLADSSPEEKPAFVMTSAPAAPPESAEARIALRQHRESAALNRFTFPGNVLQGTGDIVEHWIVMFCPGWHDKCQGLLPSYELVGVQWENKLNHAVMSSGVRFAKVDCATEKALCVSLDIEDYPSVVHYRNQQRVASWHGGAPGLVRFVKQELEGPKRRPRPKNTAAQPKITPVCADLATGLPDVSPADGAANVAHHWSVLRAACLALLLVATTRYVLLLATKAHHGLVGPALSKPNAAPKQSAQSALPEAWAAQRASIVL